MGFSRQRQASTCFPRLTAKAASLVERRSHVVAMPVEPFAKVVLRWLEIVLKLAPFELHNRCLGGRRFFFFFS